MIFNGLIDAILFGWPGYLDYPNALMVIIMLLLALAAVTAVEVSVIISTRVNDVRIAQQLGSLIMIPFARIGFVAVIAIPLCFAIAWFIPKIPGVSRVL